MQFDIRSQQEITHTALKYKEFAFFRIAHMFEGGLIDKWFAEDLLTNKVNAPKEETKSATSSMTIVHLQAAFYLLLGGLCMAALVLLAEILMA
ncbi:hypothetical protein SK128_012460 [Halocaridina rubra]|uniref:Uncharacterized protein n=1 Tax=Halocaridina rubra TaxID=373956 RepID=A0AAN8ZR11_HALRR